MAGRLIFPPAGLPVVSIEPLSGPRAVGAASTQTVGGFVQTSGAAFGLWRWQISFAAMNNSMFRRYRAWVTALHGGANATRWEFWDPDMLSPRETGIDVPARIWWTTSGNDQKWSNGKGWSSGQGWQMSPPTVPVAANAGVGDTVVSLGSVFWGHGLDSELIGFFPFHLGMYQITEVIDDGQYRIWPPLRKAITPDDFATLRPTLAMRLEGEDAATAGRGLVVAEGASVTLVEVLDYDARDYFAD